MLADAFQTERTGDFGEATVPVVPVEQVLVFEPDGRQENVLPSIVVVVQKLHTFDGEGMIYARLGGDIRKRAIRVVSVERISSHKLGLGGYDIGECKVGRYVQIHPPIVVVVGESVVGGGSSGCHACSDRLIGKGAVAIVAEEVVGTEDIGSKEIEVTVVVVVDEGSRRAECDV